MRSIFINLPVADVAVTREFFTKLGVTVNEAFSTDDVVCLVVAENICVMALHHDRFAEFVVGDTAIADARRTVQAMFALSAESRDEVDTTVETALSNGGSVYREPQDHGFMYGRSFADPDGHVWEVMWMDASAMEG